MKIVIVDDHPVVRQGVQQALEREADIEVVGVAGSCSEGAETIAALKPDLAIVDIRMPDGSGLEMVRQVRKAVAGCRIIILSSYASPRDISAAVAENVEGYVLKEALPEELLNAVRLVAKGRRYYDPEIMDSIMNKEEKDPLKGLTARELEILQSLAEGLNNRAIAQKHYISENTVKKHIGNILDKMEFQDRTQAALYAFSRGLGKKTGTD
ncbi:MAG: response regulator transcription factor [Firmicutes bacterium]|nr:response regulator transcription factor [Bacillota bacterium]